MIGATSIDLKQGTRLINCKAYLRGGGLYYDDAQMLFGKGIERRCRRLTAVVACQSLINGALNKKTLIVTITTTAIAIVVVVAMYLESSPNPFSSLSFKTLSFGLHRAVLVFCHLFYRLHCRANQAETMSSSQIIPHSSLQHFSSTSGRKKATPASAYSLFAWMET